MKSVRVFYKKKARLRFVSHLDMNRFMTRMLRKTDIPVWYTEGFHTHAYITFALPLSLGFESDYEIMDFKVTDDSISFDCIKQQLEQVMPSDIEVLAVSEPVLKTGKIAYADFCILFEDGGAFAEKLKNFLNSKEILCVKKNKKGIEKTVDLAPKIRFSNIEISGGNTKLELRLPAGGSDNVNPVMILSACCNQIGDLPYYSVTRTALLDEQENLFV